MPRRPSAAALPPVAERDVLAGALAYLATLPGEYQRNNTGVGTYQNGDGSQRRVRFGKPGGLDVVGVLPDGRHFEAEAKRVGKKPTAIQWDRIRRVNASGGVAFWFNDADQLVRVMPAILAGAWIDEGPAGVLWVTDEPRGER